MCNDINYNVAFFYNFRFLRDELIKLGVEDLNDNIDIIESAYEIISNSIKNSTEDIEKIIHYNQREMESIF